MTGLAISPSKLFCNLSPPIAISVYDAPLLLYQPFPENRCGDLRAVDSAARICKGGSPEIRRMQMKRDHDSQRSGRLAVAATSPLPVAATLAGGRNGRSPRLTWSGEPVTIGSSGIERMVIRRDGDSECSHRLLGMCGQSAPHMCIAASQLRRVRVTYNKLTLTPPPPPKKRFRTENQLTAAADRPERAAAGAFAVGTGVAAGSVWRRLSPRSFTGYRNRPAAPSVTPPALPAIQKRCRADHHPMVAHHPVWGCDPGPDVRQLPKSTESGGAK